MKKIVIRRSAIHGRGIFASEGIRKGEFVALLRGKLRHKAYPAGRRQIKHEDIWMPIAINWWIDPALPFRCINHSCDPNIGFKTPRRAHALRDIETGEELTVDYSSIEYVDHWRISCKCKTKKCRGIIRAVQYLPSRLYKSYLPYIPRFLQKVYKSRHRAV